MTSRFVGFNEDAGEEQVPYEELKTYMNTALKGSTLSTAAGSKANTNSQSMLKSFDKLPASKTA